MVIIIILDWSAKLVIRWSKQIRSELLLLKSRRHNNLLLRLRRKKTGKVTPRKSLKHLLSKQSNWERHLPLSSTTL